MLPSGEYLADAVVRFTTNSTGIEGNTLSLAQTRQLYVDPVAKDTESLEVIDNFEGMKYLLGHVLAQQPVTLGFIQQLHRLTCRQTLTDAGEFKQAENVIQFSGGRRVHQTTVAPDDVLPLMTELIADINRSLSETQPKHIFFQHLASSHLRFEQIHPFSDGNGRTGRLLMAYMAMAKSYDMPILPVAERNRYFRLLRKNDRWRLGLWLYELSEAERKRRLALTDLSMMPTLREPVIPYTAH